MWQSPTRMHAALTCQLTSFLVSPAPVRASVGCCEPRHLLQVEQALRQQLSIRMRALAEADQRFAHMEGVMQRLAQSAAPRTRASDRLNET